MYRNLCTVVDFYSCIRDVKLTRLLVMTTRFYSFIEQLVGRKLFRIITFTSVVSKTFTRAYTICP